MMKNCVARVYALAAAALLLGCGSADDQTAEGELSESSLACSRQPRDGVTGPWKFSSSDIQPSTSFAIDGEVIHLTFAGYYTWSGTWSSGFRGYTFERPVALTPGAKYRLSLDISNVSNLIPAVLRASLSGAGAEQQQSRQGNGTIEMDFTVGSNPGAAPVLSLTAHPVLGHIGPVEGTGIVFHSYDVTASLARVP